MQAYGRENAMASTCKNIPSYDIWIKHSEPNNVHLESVQKYSGVHLVHNNKFKPVCLVEYAGHVCWCVCVCAIGECSRKRTVTGTTEELKAFQGGKMNPTFTKSVQHKFVKCGWRCRASFFHVSHSLYLSLRVLAFISLECWRANTTGIGSRAASIKWCSCAHMHNMS